MNDETGPLNKLTDALGEVISSLNTTDSVMGLPLGDHVNMLLEGYTGERRLGIGQVQYTNQKLRELSIALGEYLVELRKVNSQRIEPLDAKY